MKKLVSIIIPCYNAEAWLAETIESCLQQTYPNVEVIVIDDCSTDRSADILHTYDNRIQWERQPTNQGGNAARNRGFALSKGDYIQWLDADDLILPEKIERQVSFLETNDYDAVYGDWQAKYHYPDGQSRLSDVMIPGAQTDILESLLADWWTAVASLLYRREALERAPSWSEGIDNLLNADDRPYMLSLAMSGVRIGYQPGCYSIYRRHSNSMSVASQLRWVQAQLCTVEAAQAQLSATGRLTPAYRHAIATSYFKLSRHVLHEDSRLHRQLLDRAISVAPDFKSLKEPALYKTIQRAIGFRRTERLVAAYRQLRRRRWVDKEW